MGRPRKQPEFEHCIQCGTRLPEGRRSDMRFCPPPKKGHKLPDGDAHPYDRSGLDFSCHDRYHNMRRISAATLFSALVAGRSAEAGGDTSPADNGTPLATQGASITVANDDYVRRGDETSRVISIIGKDIATQRGKTWRPWNAARRVRALIFEGLGGSRLTLTRAEIDSIRRDDPVLHAAIARLVAIEKALLTAELREDN